MNAPAQIPRTSHPSGGWRAAGPVLCDRSSCPAIALHEVDIYDQDFFFCHHHWVELAAHLPARTLSPRTDEGRTRSRRGVGAIA